MKIVIDELSTNDIREVYVSGVRKSAKSFVRDMEIIMETGEAIDLAVYSENDDLQIRIFDYDKDEK